MSNEVEEQRKSLEENLETPLWLRYDWGNLAYEIEAPIRFTVRTFTTRMGNCVLTMTTRGILMLSYSRLL